MEQYWRVKNFRAEEFYCLKVYHRTTGDVFSWKRNRLFDRAVTAALLLHCQRNGFASVKSVETKGVSKWRPLPLRTVEMQKTLARWHKWSSEKIMHVAETLYQRGYISYPRTETDMFENDFDHVSLLSRQANDPRWGSIVQNLLRSGINRPPKGAHNDKAHPPIHPTSPGGDLHGDDLRVYEFVTRRYIACLSQDAKGFETCVKLQVGSEEFSAKGNSTACINSRTANHRIELSGSVHLR